MNLRRLVLAVSLSGLVACSGSGGGGTGGGSGTAGGSGAAGGSGTAGGASNVGSIGLSQHCTTTMGVESCSAAVNAFFMVAPVNNPCTALMFGPCTLVECPLDAGIASPMLESAGAITVTGSRLDGGSFRADLDFSADAGGYSGALVLERLWNGGETFTVSATGATVPAISNRTVTAPAPVTLTSPVCTSSGCAPIPRSQPLTVSWSGGAGTSVSIGLTSARTGDPTKILSCTFTSSPGTIPANALGRLNQSDAGYTNVLTVLNTNTTTVNAGAWSTGISATNSGGGGVFYTAD